MGPEKLLDETDIRIVSALEENARISFAELARKVGLSGPATNERVRKLEESGVLLGYRTIVDRSRLGFPVQAFLRIAVAPEHYSRVISLARELREVRECYRTEGADDFMLRVSAASNEDLETIAGSFREIGTTVISPIVSTPVEKYTT